MMPRRPLHLKRWPNSQLYSRQKEFRIPFLRKQYPTSAGLALVFGLTFSHPALS